MQGNKMQEKLAYSKQGLKNRIIFFSDDSKILIFVEDENKEFEYDYIFDKMSEQFKIKVLALGGKSAVKKQFNQYNEKYKNKPVLYLVDADFDLLLNQNLIIHPNFIYLQKYNIESYLINKESILKFIQMLKRIKKSDVLKVFNYDVWLKDAYSSLKELFLYFAIVQSRPDIFGGKKNVDLGFYSFLGENNTIDGNKIKKYKKELELIFDDIDILVSDMENKFTKNLGGDCSRLICGKYIIACLTNNLKNNLHLKFKDRELRNYLIDNFNIKDFNFLKDKIEELYQNN